MDKYYLVEERRLDCDLAAVGKNEVRITQIGKMRNYVNYAHSLFQEKEASAITLKAMGRAINKTITIAETLKRLIAGLHQITELSTCDLLDIFEPLEEGLDRVENVRHVSCIVLVLSFLPLDENHVGYQPPLSTEEFLRCQAERVTTLERNRKNCRKFSNDFDSNIFPKQGPFCPQYLMQVPTFTMPLPSNPSEVNSWPTPIYARPTMIFHPQLISPVGSFVSSSQPTGLGFSYPALYSAAGSQPGNTKIFQKPVYSHPIQFPYMQPAINPLFVHFPEQNAVTVSDWSEELRKDETKVYKCQASAASTSHMTLPTSPPNQFSSSPKSEDSEGTHPYFFENP